MYAVVAAAVVLCIGVLLLFAHDVANPRRGVDGATLAAMTLGVIALILVVMTLLLPGR